MKPSRVQAMLCLITLLMVGRVASGADPRDGNWWNTLSPGHKAGWAVGFLDGLAYAQGLMSASALAAVADPKTGQFDAARAKIVFAAADLGKDQLTSDFGHVTAGNLVQGLDHIFADYRNARINVLDATMVVVRSMNGMPDAEVQKMLEGKRSGETAAFK